MLNAGFDGWRGSVVLGVDGSFVRCGIPVATMVGSFIVEVLLTMLRGVNGAGTVLPGLEGLVARAANLAGSLFPRGALKFRLCTTPSAVPIFSTLIAGCNASESSFLDVAWPCSASSRLPFALDFKGDPALTWFAMCSAK